MDAVESSCLLSLYPPCDLLLHAVNLEKSEVEFVFELPHVCLTHGVLALVVALQLDGFPHRLLERQRLAHALQATRQKMIRVRLGNEHSSSGAHTSPLILATK